MRIDHVIYATADLDAAAAHVGAVLGLAAAGGGRHDRIGTHNRIVPFDDGYLELLAVADPEEAAASTLGAAIRARLASDGEGLFAWAVRVDDVGAVAARLGTEVTTIARAGFSAHLTGVAEAMADPLLPFFIARDPGVPGPVPRPGAPAIEWIEVGGHAPRLADWLGGAELPVRVARATPGVHALSVGGRELRS